MSSRGPGGTFSRSVFINCPFDDEYASLLRPLLFTTITLGYHPRIASESSDGGENRLDKIIGLIRSSRYSIHDISRLKSTKAGQFSRFNLPFELGLDHGARRFGVGPLKGKRVLVLEATQHDYKQAISDLAGVDIKSHKNDPSTIVRAVRNWFVETANVPSAAGPTAIWSRFTDFASALYDERRQDGFSDEDLADMPVPELIREMTEWHLKRQ